MSLVAYGSSDESEVEDVGNIHNIKQNDGVRSNESSENGNLISTSFNSLPVPKYHSLFLNSVGVSQKKDKRVISIPSLTEFDDDDDNFEEDSPQIKRMKQSSKGCGLMALLPSPKNKSLVPSNVSTKVISSVASKLDSSVSSGTSKLTSPLVSSMSSKSNLSSIGNKNVNFSNDHRNDAVNSIDETNTSNDFFSLSSNSDEKSIFSRFCNSENINTHTTGHDDDISVQWNQIKVEVPMNNVIPFISDNPNDINCNINNTNAQQLPDKNNLFKEEGPLTLTEEMLVKLCGRRNRLQNSEELKLIDINEDVILADSKLMLTKHLTEENTYKPSRKKNEGPSAVEKRKHQITYLAHQAKEREMELKNQWASNKLTKKQTQAKYGF